MALFATKEDEKKDVDYKVDASSAQALKIPSVLIQPRISEKSGKLAAMNKYVFKVKNSANKVEVKKAVENFYKVHVMQVNMVVNSGKARNFGQRAGRTSSFKKAIVTLKKGDSIQGLTDVV